MSELRLFGSSDDLIEAEGAVYDEWDAYNNPVEIRVKARNDDGDKVQVLLRADYDDDGYWRFTEPTPCGLVTIIPARGEARDHPVRDEDGCPDYSDKAIIRGGYKVKRIEAIK